MGAHCRAGGLQILSASEGNILEDESAISVITEAKGLGNEITNKQKVAEQTEQEIERARTAYKPCGDYTAILFFCISGGSAVLIVHSALCLPSPEACRLQCSGLESMQPTLLHLSAARVLLLCTMRACTQL